MRNKTIKIMELNKVIELKKGDKLNISTVKPHQRIVYIKDTNSAVVVYSQRVAPQIRILYGESAVMMSPGQAIAMYPEIFYTDKSEEVPRRQFDKHLFLYVSEKQEKFVKTKGNVSEYIRSIIDREMDREKFTDSD